MVAAAWPWLRRSRRAEFDREVLPHLDALYGTALRLCRNARDAEDLVQDTALRAFRFFHRFEAGTNARAWLFKILHNTFATKYRRSSRERALLDGIDESAPGDAPVPSAAPGPEEAALARSFSDEVQRALDRLPEEFRAAVILCDLEEFSYKEIAEILDIPVGTVMSRLHRGRRLLQEQLRGYAVGAGLLRPEGAATATDDEGPRVAAVIPLRPARAASAGADEDEAERDGRSRGARGAREARGARGARDARDAGDARGGRGGKKDGTDGGAPGSADGSTP